jgi:hypothetical protein
MPLMENVKKPQAVDAAAFEHNDDTAFKNNDYYLRCRKIDPADCSVV